MVVSVTVIKQCHSKPAAREKKNSVGFKAFPNPKASAVLSKGFSAHLFSAGGPGV